MTDMENLQKDLLKECRLCPRNCRIDRSSNNKGYCGESDTIRVARASLHMWEEPCISGENGSGTVFFSGCNLKCVFCQNRSIALGDKGRKLNKAQLAELFCVLQEKGASNINLVTPTHYVPMIAEAIAESRAKGMKLPIVYNTGSYEKMETLKLLDGLVDIYLPDMKYLDSALSGRYSNAPDYFENASHAIAEMVRQTGKPVFENQLMKKGTIVRHMILPGCTKDSKNIIKYLYETYGDDVYISIMNQYTPPADMQNYDEIKRKVTKREYEKVIDYAIDLGVTNAFIQEGDTASESFIPDFNDNVFLDEVL
jgi:putative pyruvate formate lyase activating enzyme